MKSKYTNAVFLLKQRYGDIYAVKPKAMEIMSLPLKTIKAETFLPVL